jgi:hypothetical protein
VASMEKQSKQHIGEHPSTRNKPNNAPQSAYRLSLRENSPPPVPVACTERGFCCPRQAHRGEARARTADGAQAQTHADATCPTLPLHPCPCACFSVD